MGENLGVLVDETLVSATLFRLALILPSTSNAEEPVPSVPILMKKLSPMSCLPLSIVHQTTDSFFSSPGDLASIKSRPVLHDVFSDPLYHACVAPVSVVPLRRSHVEQRMVSDLSVFWRVSRLKTRLQRVTLSPSVRPHLFHLRSAADIHLYRLASFRPKPYGQRSSFTHPHIQTSFF